MKKSITGVLCLGVFIGGCVGGVTDIKNRTTDTADIPFLCHVYLDPYSAEQQRYAELELTDRGVDLDGRECKIQAELSQNSFSNAGLSGSPQLVATKGFAERHGLTGETSRVYEEKKENKDPEPLVIGDNVIGEVIGDIFGGEDIELF